MDVQGAFLLLKTRNVNCIDLLSALVHLSAILNTDSPPLTSHRYEGLIQISPPLTGADVEQRHERVIQHRDRSTTYTLGGPRCSRTDGKHWQCKREALPDQKYCEKHLHRGLLRSRKRKREDNFQDLEGERLFQGWQRAKPKVQLWPGLCQPPSEMVSESLIHRRCSCGKTMGYLAKTTADMTKGLRVQVMCEPLCYRAASAMWKAKSESHPFRPLLLQHQLRGNYLPSC